jgi:hypothetical protein
VVSPVSSPGVLLMLPGCGAGACRGRRCGAARSRPASPIPPAKSACASTAPGGGPPRSPKASTGRALHSPDRPASRATFANTAWRRLPQAAIPPARAPIRAHTTPSIGHVPGPQPPAATTQDRKLRSEPLLRADMKEGRPTPPPVSLLLKPCSRRQEVPSLKAPRNPMTSREPQFTTH